MKNLLLFIASLAIGSMTFAQTICSDFNITGLAHGTVVNNLFAGDGVTIQVFPNSGGTTNAVIYNSDGNWTEDPDLNSDAGNVIIMNENPNNSDGDGTGPDDNGNGGTLRFLFDEPVTVVSVLVIDADHAGSSIKVYDGTNSLMKTVSIPVGANGNVQTVNVNADDVSRVDIVYPNSGGFRLNLSCPPASAPEDCPEFDIAGLAHGTIVNNLFSGDGLTIQVFPNAGGTSNAVIYNTDGNWTEDPDLNSDAGNVIIMNENPNNGDGDGTGPDDNGNGGTLRFLFDEAVTVNSVLVVDADHAGSSIRAYNGSNSLIKTVNIPVGANGNVQTVNVNADNVSRLDIVYPNSGGFRLDLTCPEECIPFDVDITTTQPTFCNSICNGSASVNPLGGAAPYDYSWSSGQQTQSISGLCEGAYTVTVTDDEGCTGTASTTITCPPAEQPDDCPEFDISNLAHGTIVNNLFSGDGLTIQVFPNAGGTSNAVIYNTDGNWTEDPDLNSDAGNVIIMNENPNNGDGDGTGPDDNAKGGTLRFLFEEAVTVNSILVVDADHAGSSIKAYDGSNTLIKTVAIPVGANGNVQTVNVNADEVSRIDIVYPNSGGFRLDLTCPSEPGQQPTLCDSFDISGLAHGTIVNNLFADDGVTIQVFPNTGGTTNAVIYNSNGNWTEDPDLNSDAGNVIIMNENPNNGDGDGMGPDDNGKGGTLRFLFDEAVTVVSVLVIDADHANSTIKAYNGSNSLIKTVSIPVGPDGNVQTVAVNASGVSRLDITYPNSGGFRLNLLCEDGAAKTTVIEQQQMEESLVMNAYPNPFERQVTLEFQINETSKIKAEILTVDGRTIQTLFDGVASENQLYQMQLDGSNLPGGMYIYRVITQNGQSYHHKLFVTK